MRVEHLISKGGLRIYDNADRLIISRLSLEGETQISLNGLDFNYDPAGNLVYAVMRATEFLAVQEKWFAQASPEFSEFFDFLRRSGREFVVRIDLLAETAVVVLQSAAGDRETFQGPSMIQMAGKPVGVTLEINDQIVGTLSVLVRKENGYLVIGAGSVEGAVVFRQTLQVNYDYLTGDLSGESGLAKVKCFVYGRKPDGGDR